MVDRISDKCSRTTPRKTKSLSLKLGAWNSHTLIDNTNIGRPARCIALVGKELSRYDLDIIALSETQLPDTGQLKEQNVGYAYYWSGKIHDESCEADVAFAIKNYLLPKLAEPPKAISELGGSWYFDFI